MFRRALRRNAAYRLFSFRGITASPSSQAWLVPQSSPLRASRSLSYVVPASSDLTGRGSSNLISGNDTVYALSSAPGRGAIAIVRISGPGSLDVYHGLCPAKPLPKARHAVVRTLVEPSTENDVNVLDSDALVLYFPGPRTATGEDILELHIHGGPATVKAVLSAIPKCSSETHIRYAEPGEFTKRAFLNNRLDLSQVESLGDTLAAETEQQRRAAIRGASNILGKTYEGWWTQLLLARGEIEALIDFSEDQHFDESPVELLANVTQLVEGMLHSIHAYKDGSQRSELLRNGIRIALLGPPNAGKSSLMNRIVGREASIVSAEPGTTRDIVEASLDIRGYLCSFADTAGIRVQDASLRGSGEPLYSDIGIVEQEGIRRARKKAQDSDVIIAVTSVERTMDGRIRLLYDVEALTLAANAPQCLIVINKSDVVDHEALAVIVREFRHSVLGSIRGLGGTEPLLISCKAAESRTVGLTDPGRIEYLTEKLVQSFSNLTSLPSGMQHLLGVTERQSQLLEQCQAHLKNFLTEARGRGSGAEPDIVLAAEHLRLAASRLAAIVGRGESGDVEEVLGVIFEKFCVGK